MKKVVINLVLAVSLMFTYIANTNANIILSLDPVTQTSNTGSIVSVTLNVDGLGDFVPLSLSSFDIDVTFNASALTFIGYSLFDNLGDLAFFDADDFSWGEYVPGTVNVSEISYLSNFDLWNFQPGNFDLAELLFSVDAPVTSAVSFQYAEMIDVNGDIINIVGINDAEITGVASVPEPATLILICLGLLTLFVRQKHQQ